MTDKMTDYNSLVQEAFKPIEKTIKVMDNYPSDLSKLIRQENNLYIKDGGTRYLDPDTNIVYVYKKYNGTIKEEFMNDIDRCNFFGN